MSNWNNWRVIITSTQAEDFVLRTEDQGAPTVGPNGEIIDTAKSRIVNHRDDNEVKIKQEEVLTGGRYQFRHIKIVAPPNQTTTVIVTHESGVNIVSAMCQFTSDMTGDFLRWTVSPNTTAGVLMSPTAVNDTVLSVSQTVIDNIDETFEVRLALDTDPTGTFEDIGKVTEIDSENLTITVTTPVTQIWAAATTLVQITAVFVDNIEIGELNWTLNMGSDKIGSSYLPKGTPIVCSYTNNSLTATKTMYNYYSFLYGVPKP